MDPSSELQSVRFRTGTKELQLQAAGQNSEVPDKQQPPQQQQKLPNNGVGDPFDIIPNNNNQIQKVSPRYERVQIEDDISEHSSSYFNFVYDKVKCCKCWSKHCGCLRGE